MLKLNDNEKDILRTVHLYVDGKGVGLSGHHMMNLMARIDAERVKLALLLDMVSDDVDEGNWEGLRSRLAEYYSG